MKSPRLLRSPFLWILAAFLLIILGMIRREMTKLLYPKAVVPLTLNKTPIDEKVCIAVLAYFMVTGRRLKKVLREAGEKPAPPVIR